MLSGKNFGKIIMRIWELKSGSTMEINLNSEWKLSVDFWQDCCLWNGEEEYQETYTLRVYDRHTNKLCICEDFPMRRIEELIEPLALLLETQSMQAFRYLMGREIA